MKFRVAGLLLAAVCSVVAPPASADAFMITQGQYDRMFPNRNDFYTFAGLRQAANSFPAFANGDDRTVRRQEFAAFLANVSHETGGLRFVVEQNPGGDYCEPRPFGCPEGPAAYHGRGPLQLSWNYNYQAAGDALGADLLHRPNLLQTNATLSWRAALWYWMTQNGPGSMTPHQAMVRGRGFGETIRSINGALECNGGNPAQVASRVRVYREFTGILDVRPGDQLSC
ncbi:chitinase [Lentzea tibetensis]|uniref:Chitinase n=1 Tax=Lentzea tibetensis TaxID=2591470 RepID=A0A563F297_9PSEU|nr:chitinase [Lentzea tibetensis]TWP53932.1 chitinase [Lentzea tibetensis]